MILVNAKAGPSQIHGIGLIAQEFIPKGTRVWKFMPGFDIKIPEAEIGNLSPAAQSQLVYYAFLETSSRTFVLSSDDDRFTNHADDPNTRSVDENHTIAVRDIQKGEEITADYKEIHVRGLFLAAEGVISDFDLYTPLEEAVAELHRRRQDNALCSKVAEFQRTHPPHFLNGQPAAFLLRPLFSADLEFRRFLELSARTRLQPFPLEITKDKFTSFNKEKYRRGKLTFRFSNQLRSLRAMDFQYDGKPFSDIPSLDGCSLVDFHHYLIAHSHPELNERIRDISDWFFVVGQIEPKYLHLLSLAISNGVLFENFILDDPEEKRFVEERLRPSFIRAAEIFGMKPLIVRLFSPEEEQEPWLWDYPGELYAVAAGFLKKRKKEQCHA